MYDVRVKRSYISLKVYKMNDRITVITICYNAAALLPLTMRSVLAQDYHDLEYIIEDGESTDTTLNVVESFRKSFEDRGITFIYNRKPDEGIYDAMNKAAALATGSYICFMNAGDCFYSTGAVSSAAAAAADDPVIIYGDCAVYEFGRFYMFAKSLEDIEKTMPFSHQSVFAKSSFLRDHPFDTSYRYSADYDLLLTAHDLGVSFCDTGDIICITTADGTSSVNYLDTMMETIRIQKAHGVCHLDEGRIKRTRILLAIKQFVLDHFPLFIKKRIRGMQIASRGQEFAGSIPPWFADHIKNSL